MAQEGFVLAFPDVPLNVKNAILIAAFRLKCVQKNCKKSAKSVREGGSKGGFTCTVLENDGCAGGSIICTFEQTWSLLRGNHSQLHMRNHQRL